jgi:hypothetical protein
LKIFFSSTLLTQESKEIGLLLDGKDLSPFLNKGITSAIFQSDGNTFSSKDLLNKLHNRFDISSPLRVNEHLGFSY